MEEKRKERLKRMMELFRPIEQQIMMTDDEDDMILLASIMLTTSINSLVKLIGPDKTIKMIDQLDISRRE